MRWEPPPGCMTSAIAGARGRSDSIRSTALVGCASKGWSDQVTRLVAWHTRAEKEAELRGVARYDEEFARLPAFVVAVLTWADLTSTPDGDVCQAEGRLRRILETHPAGSLVHEATRPSWTLLMDHVAAAKGAMEASGGQSS